MEKIQKVVNQFNDTYKYLEDVLKNPDFKIFITKDFR